MLYIGYHVYKDIWAAAIGKVLVCGRGQPMRKTFSYILNVFCNKKNEVRYYHDITVQCLYEVCLCLPQGCSIAVRTWEPAV